MRANPRSDEATPPGWQRLCGSSPLVRILVEGDKCAARGTHFSSQRPCNANSPHCPPAAELLPTEWLVAELELSAAVVGAASVKPSIGLPTRNSGAWVSRYASKIRLSIGFAARTSQWTCQSGRAGFWGSRHRRPATFVRSAP